MELCWAQNAGSACRSDMMPILRGPNLSSRPNLLAVAVAILVTASSPVPAATGPGTAILLKPGTRLDGKDWAYIYRRDIPAGTLIPLPRSLGASQAVLSPDGSVV